MFIKSIPIYTYKSKNMELQFIDFFKKQISIINMSDSINIKLNYIKNCNNSIKLNRVFPHPNPPPLPQK